MEKGRRAVPVLSCANDGTKWIQTEQQGGAYSNQSPVPSIRLKAYCYGQQDVETDAALLATRFRSRPQCSQRQRSYPGIDRYRWGEQVLAKLGWSRSRGPAESTLEDTGWADYGTLTPEMFEMWRREWRRENR